MAGGKQKPSFTAHCSFVADYLLFGGLFPRPPPEGIPGFLLGALGGAGVCVGALGAAPFVAIVISVTYQLAGRPSGAAWARVIQFCGHKISAVFSVLLATYRVRYPAEFVRTEFATHRQ